ncbi:hypothetical protein FHS94_002230 [Sphingomonas aerophila]|jgi:hypothetical protein|uniref:Uncharacterized protein n=1 Tax=Sphingomonas aerophila TaxID=1344948 RepID=A0A7W9EUL3_9SPHN|nr:hypothetical protein [Sphingomonas aerophila]
MSAPIALEALRGHQEPALGNLSRDVAPLEQRP